MSQPRPDIGAFTALSLGAVLIGLAPIFVRLADVGPVACAFWRCFLAWPVLLIALKFEQRKSTDTNAVASPLGLIGAGLFFAADLSLWHYAIGKTSVANATLLANLAPLFVAPAAWLLWREGLTRGFLAGLAIALAGTFVLVGSGAELNRATLAGDALAIAAAAFYAGYLLMATRLRRSHSALQLMTWSSATVAVMLLPVAWISGESIWPASTQGWLVLSGLALLSHVGGQGLIAYSLATLSAAFSAVGLLVQPLAAAIFAWFLLGEIFGLSQALGGAVILAGILCCRLAGTAQPLSRSA
ncbi:MAG: DMT family transporter [Panacagrimonas sp.]